MGKQKRKNQALQVGLEAERLPPRLPQALADMKRADTVTIIFFPLHNEQFLFIYFLFFY